MQSKQILSGVIIILFLVFCIFAGIKKSQAIKIENKIKQDSEFYFSNTTIPEDVLRQVGVPSQQYVDKEKLNNFITKPGNYEMLKKAIGMYVTIKTAENRIPGYCNKYYNMGSFKQKMSKNFVERKNQSYQIFENAFGTQWEKAITSLYDNLYYVYKDKHIKQMEAEYQGAKTQMALVGLELSRQEFCKQIANDPEYFINYENERFYKEFGK